MGNEVEIINTGEVLSKRLNHILKNENIENLNNQNGNYKIFLTDTETNFVNVAEKLLQDNLVLSKINKCRF